jgi:outer membrane protein OmpA-like peptidoglycan-associated protein
MKNKYKVTFLAITFLSVIGITAQEKQIEKANDEYENSAYIDASEIYLKVIKSGFKSAEIILKLGNAYYFNANYIEAVKWYDELYVYKEQSIDKSYLLRYSQSLKAVGDTKKAAKIYDEFLKLSEILNDDFRNTKDYLDIIEMNSNRYDLDTLHVNSKYIEYGSFFRNDTLYFSSTRNNRSSIGRIDAWNNDRFLDVYTTVFDSQKEKYLKPRLLKGDVNSKYHESSIAITKDGKTMYFTRSNSTFLEKKGKKAITHLKIYRATKIKNRWANIEDLSINSDNYSSAHPVLSPDEKTLFYVSDMPGSIGKTDIYSVDIYDKGELGKPKNLGPKVNTKGRESFPFISSDYELYFSSDGHFGLGGYDVFYFDLVAKQQQLINVGKPINSANDDFAFAINNFNKKGFVSSNRSGVDNIYTLVETIPIKDILEFNLSGFVTDKKTKELLANATITVTDRNGKIQSITATNSEGKFNVKINRFKSNIVKAEKVVYATSNKFIPVEDNKKVAKLELEKNQIAIKDGVDLAKDLNITIYYDFDKATIRKDAAVELEKIVAVLQKHKEINIVLNSHTDSRGRALYNLRLSEKRAQRAIEYLIKRGIDKNRLSGKGYGETELLIDCKYPEKCSREEYQLNRRTEFIIKVKQP